MERIFCRKNLCIALYSVIFAVFFFSSFAKFGNFLIDTGREFYTPFAMVNFKTALFKDIICIYGPLPYMINALLLKIFGSSFALFNFIGAFSAYFFGLFFFLLSNKFLNEINSLILTLAVLAVSMFDPSPIFNFIVPYSYAMLYAVFFAIVALFCLINFIKTKAPRDFILASFFISLTLLSKFDFIILILPLLVLAFYIKPSLKTLLKAVLAFLIPVIPIVFYLILNKISISDIGQNFRFISNMANAPSLKAFYSMFSGFTPNLMRFKTVFPVLISQIVVILVPLAFLLISKTVKNRFITGFFKFLCAVSGLYCFLFFLVRFKESHCIFCYTALLFAVLFAIEIIKFFKKKEELNPEIFLHFFCFIFSIKTLFFLLTDCYGAFYFPFILLPLVLLLKKNLKITNQFYLIIKKYFTCVFIGLIVVFSFFSLRERVFSKLTPVSTSQGVFYASKTESKIFETLFDLIKTENSDNEPILGLPEGLFFNFIFKNNYKIYPTSFIPLDFDAYGEEFLTKNVLKANPKIIIFSPRDCTEYGKAALCKDFGQNFCSAVLKNYDYKAIIGAQNNALKFAVYVRKD